MSKGYYLNLLFLSHLGESSLAGKWKEIKKHLKLNVVIFKKINSESNIDVVYRTPLTVTAFAEYIFRVNVLSNNHTPDPKEDCSVKHHNKVPFINMSNIFLQHFLQHVLT